VGGGLSPLNLLCPKLYCSLQISYTERFLKSKILVILFSYLFYVVSPIVIVLLKTKVKKEHKMEEDIELISQESIDVLNRASSRGGQNTADNLGIR